VLDKKKIMRSVSSMGLCSGVTAVLSIVQLSFTARFLSPDDYGMIVIPSVIVGAFNVFLIAIPLGLIQRDLISNKDSGAIHRRVLLVGGGMYAFLLLINCLFFFVSGGLEFFIVLLALGLQLLVTSLVITYQVLLRRDMLMQHVAMAQVLSVVFGCVIAMLFAYLGAGFWALIYAALGRSIVAAVYMRLKSTHSFGPSDRGLSPQGREMLRFGVSRGVDHVLGQFTSKVDQLVISGAMGQAAVGVYSVSSNVARRPSDLIRPIVGSVMFPMYARLRSDRSRYNRVFSDTVMLLGMLMVCIATSVSMLAPEVVYLLLGERWQSATPVLSVIPFYFAFMLIGVPCNEAAIANGKTRRLIVWNVTNAATLGVFLLVAIVLYDSLFLVALTAVAVRVFALLFAFPCLLGGSGLLWFDPVLRLCLCVLLPVFCFYGSVCLCWGLEVFSAPFGLRILALVIFHFILILVNVKYMRGIIRGWSKL
jgi:lipopolysaccharide exporter